MITFTTGLMASGKSKELIEKFKKRNDYATSVIFSTHITGKTGSLSRVTSRNGQYLSSIVIQKDDIDESLKVIKDCIDKGCNTIYVDEIQFLSKDSMKKIISLAEEFKIDLHLYGLLTTFTDQYFESSIYLTEILPRENISYIRMKCQISDCSSSARHNARIFEGKVQRSGDTFVEKKANYMSLCSEHYFS